jgi:hypothetical protein
MRKSSTGKLAELFHFNARMDCTDREAGLLIAARGGIENLRRYAVAGLPAAVEDVENTENNSVAQSHSGGEREHDHGEYCERHHQGKHFMPLSFVQAIRLPIYPW